jgi:transposase
MPPAGIRQLRTILSRRRHFVKIATSQINAAKFVLRSHGLRTTGICLTTQAGWEKLLGRPDVAAMAGHLRMHARLWADARSLIVRLEKELDRALAPVRYEMDLLCTAPGVGLVTTASFIATIGNPARFATGGQVVSYVGLAPSTHDSGDRERHGHITRQGCSSLRAVLVEAAHQARRINHPLNPYYRRMAAKSGIKSAVVAVAARTARILWRMWLSNTRFTIDKLNVEFKLATRTKTYLFRLKEVRPSATA